MLLRTCSELLDYEQLTVFNCFNMTKDIISNFCTNSISLGNRP